MPYTLFKDFVVACKNTPERVNPKYDAICGAKDYKLDTESELIQFIGNGGLEDPHHFDIEEWRLKPARIKGSLYVYDYSCLIQGRPRCYIALISLKDNWIIKSFKADDGRKRKKSAHQLNLKYTHRKNDD